MLIMPSKLAHRCKAAHYCWAGLFPRAIFLITFAATQVFFSAESYAGSAFSKGHREALKRGCKIEMRRGLYKTMAECRRLEKQKIISHRELVNLKELTKNQKNNFQLACLKAMSRGLLAYDNCLYDKFVKLGLREEVSKSTQRLPKVKRPKPLQKRPSSLLDGTAKKLTTSTLVAMLEKGTVLILSQSGTGSGFFIAPDLIITNRHVVEGAKGNVYITSRAIGRVHPAAIKARSTKPGTPGQRDFALLSMNKNSGRDFSFSINLAPVKLGSVIASGYPGLVVENDESFSRLLKGDISAAPDLVLSRGEISANQTSEDGVGTLAHTAQIMHGNSGGPLLDACGRVVGVNTFINVGKGGKVGFALSADELLNFLDSYGVAAKVDKRSCEN
jgi:S1-C subfamily serine protease